MHAGGQAHGERQNIIRVGVRGINPRVQGFFYFVFGVFFDSQALRILDVSTPPILDTYGPGLRRVFGFGITFATIAFAIVTWTTLLWSSVKLGGLSRRFRRP